jgi:hypothetical protein
MKKATAAGNPAAAQLVACECVVIAETKDHADWELLAKCAGELKGAQQQALKEACEVVEEDACMSGRGCSPSPEASRSMTPIR